MTNDCELLKCFEMQKFSKRLNWIFHKNGKFLEEQQVVFTCDDVKYYTSAENSYYWSRGVHQQLFWHGKYATKAVKVTDHGSLKIKRSKRLMRRPNMHMAWLVSLLHLRWTQSRCWNSPISSNTKNYRSLASKKSLLNPRMIDQKKYS